MTKTGTFFIEISTIKSKYLKHNSMIPKMWHSNGCTHAFTRFTLDFDTKPAKIIFFERPKRTVKYLATEKRLL